MSSCSAPTMPFGTGGWIVPADFIIASVLVLEMKNLLKLGVLLSVSILCLLPGIGEGRGKKKNKPHVEVDESRYAGSDTCRICHEKIYEGFEKTAHYKTLLHTNWTADRKGCESCHGPGKEHAESGDKTKIFRFVGVPAEDITNACLKCHEGEEERHNFRRSEHNVNSVTCTACHSQHHSAKRAESLLREEPTKLCYSCHGEVKSEFSMPFRHRVSEGILKCIDCHNQHGGFNLKLTRATNETDSICVKCHSDKQGPFVFEHPPVKVEGCTACHLPHGSTNPKMLRRNQVRFVCLECHSNVVGTPGDRRGPITPASHNMALPRWQNCTTCHSNIHGSNLHPLFFE